MLSTLPFKQTIFKNKLFKLALVSIFSLSIFSSLLVLPVSASQYFSEANVVVDKGLIRENVYASGYSVDYKGSVSKDLLVSGGSVKVSGNVDRNLYISGGSVEVSSKRIGGSLLVSGGVVNLSELNVRQSVRMAGAVINFSGNVAEDLLILGQTITIKDSQVLGDINVSGGTIDIQNSVIKGNLYLSGEISQAQMESLQSQVKGEIFVESPAKKSFLEILARSLGSILVLIFLVLFLKKKGILETKKVKFGSQFGLDLLISLAILPLSVILLIVSFIVQIYPVVVPLIGLAVFVSILSYFYAPIYIANWLKNSFKIKISIEKLVAVIYVSVAILYLVPKVNVLAGLILAVFILANLVFVGRSMIMGLNTAIMYASKNNLTTNPKKNKTQNKAQEDKED